MGEVGEGVVKSVEIGKEFHWEMGHRLPFHEGGCRNVHGHSYQMRLSIVGELDENGMVVDYFDLRDIVEPIIESVDHAFLCDRSDSTMLRFLEENRMKHVVVPFPSTAENIAAWLLEQISEPLSRYEHLESIAIRLQETERTHAEVRREL